MKSFGAWMETKEKIDGSAHRPPFVSERDIWWIRMGINVGSEIDGKSEFFSRPVLVLCKFSRNTFLIIPLSTKLHKGIWYVPFMFRNRTVVACLHQARTIDYRRLLDKKGRLQKEDFCRVQKGFKELLDI